MDKESAKRVIDKMFYGMWNKQNLAMADEIFAKKFKIHYSVHVLKDLNEFKNLLNHWFMAIPDLKHTIDDYIIEDNKVVARWHGQGTHQGEFVGIPPTGKAFYYGGITILTLNSDGKIITAWVYNDLSDTLAELKSVDSPNL